MPFTLKVVFEGICAFVPSEMLFRNRRNFEQIKQMNVLLPDLRLPDVAYWDRTDPASATFWRAPHLAFLEVERDALGSGTDARIDLDWFDPNRKFRRSAFFLGQRRVEIEGGVGDPLEVAQLQCSGMVPVDEAEERSLWWLPRMADIAPDFAWFPARTTDADAGKLPGLASSVLIREGQIFVKDYNRRRDNGMIQPWSFGAIERDATGALRYPAQDLGKWRKAAANRIVWQLEIEKAAVLKLTDSEGRTRSVVVRPPIGSDGVPIEVRIANVEPEVGLLGAEPFFGALPEPLPDPDFQAFYRLVSGAAGPKSPGDWPVPLPQTTALGQHEKPCVPALFNGFGEDAE